MVGIRISQRTGKFYASFEEYLENEIRPAFMRVRKYARLNRKGDERIIQNRDDLLDFIEEATGTRNDGFAREITRLSEYKELVQENKISKKTSFAYDKERAKQEKIVFVGRNKRGQLYAYDHKRKCFVSPKKYV